MSNPDSTLVDRADEAGMSLATCAETRGQLSSGVRRAQPDHHIPGDTRTPPAPGAVRIGPEDV